MKIEQTAELVNQLSHEMLGDEAIETADLSNVVDVGRAIQNLDSWQNKVISSLVNRIGRTHYVNRVYSGDVPSIFMDSWEFGSIMAKFQTDLVEAEDNPAWELQDGMEYNENLYTNPTARAKFWNQMTTHMVKQSIPDYQLKDSFKDAQEMASFISMLHNRVTNSMNLQNQSLVYQTIANLIGEVLHDGQDTQKIKLVTMYNTQFGKNITSANAIFDPDFLRYAVLVISRTAARMHNYSSLFNNGQRDRFTPGDRMSFVLHADFKAAMGVYLYNAQNQYNTEYLGLPSAETVPFWTGSGTSYALGDITKVDIVTGSGNTVKQDYVIGVLFDRWACGVANMDSRVDTKYNHAANFTNYWYKRQARYFNDTDENAVVFTLT